MKDPVTSEELCTYRCIDCDDVDICTKLEDKPHDVCPACDEHSSYEKFIAGVCKTCHQKGWWMDPAGGLHEPDETDPAAQYE